MVEHRTQIQNLDCSNPNNTFAEAIAGVVSQQRPQTSSALLKLTTTNTLVSDGTNEKLEIFEDFFQATLTKQPEIRETMKANHSLSQIRKNHYRHSATLTPAKSEHLKTYSLYSNESTSYYNHKPQRFTNRSNAIRSPTCFFKSDLLEQLNE